MIRSRMLRKAKMSNPNFITLHWKDDRERIKGILSRIPEKYLNNLTHMFRALDTDYLYCRYDGCEFRCSLRTLKREWHRRYGHDVEGYDRRMTEINHEAKLKRWEYRHELWWKDVQKEIEERRKKDEFRCTHQGN